MKNTQNPISYLYYKLAHLSISRRVSYEKISALLLENERAQPLRELFNICLLDHGE